MSRPLSDEQLALLAAMKERVSDRPAAASTGVMDDDRDDFPIGVTDRGEKFPVRPPRTRATPSAAE